MPLIYTDMRLNQASENPLLYRNTLSLCCEDICLGFRHVILYLLKATYRTIPLRAFCCSALTRIKTQPKHDNIWEQNPRW